MNRDELIARAISDTQKEATPGTRGERSTTLQSIINSPSFSSMDVQDKANIIKQFADNREEEAKHINFAERAKLVGKAALKGTVTEGLRNSLALTVPLALTTALSHTPGASKAEAAKHITKVFARALPWVTGISGISAGVAKNTDINGYNHTAMYNNRILDKIKESKDQETRELNAMKILASAGRIIQDAEQNADFKARDGDFYNALTASAHGSQVKQVQQELEEASRMESRRRAEAAGRPDPIGGLTGIDFSKYD